MHETKINNKNICLLQKKEEGNNKVTKMGPKKPKQQCGRTEYNYMCYYDYIDMH